MDYKQNIINQEYYEHERKQSVEKFKSWNKSHGLHIDDHFDSYITFDIYDVFVFYD